MDLILDAIGLNLSNSIASLSYRSYDSPKLIEALDGLTVIEIATGSSHSAAIVCEGDLYTWGLGEYGRLGHGDTETQLKPKMVCLTFLISLYYPDRFLPFRLFPIFRLYEIVLGSHVRYLDLNVLIILIVIRI